MRRGRTGRLIATDLLHRRKRALALTAGLVIAAVSFVLLTAAVDTSQAEVRGAVQSSFRPAYDLLVRPAGTRSSIESRRRLVPDNFGSGLFGGISFGQYHRIQHLGGVDVAAPVANIGYVMPTAQVTISVNPYLGSAPVQLFRINARDLSQRGLSSYPAGVTYVYYTRADRFQKVNAAGLAVEHTAHGPVDVCEGVTKAEARAGPATSPFDDSGPTMTCFSQRLRAFTFRKALSSPG